MPLIGSTSSSYYSSLRNKLTLGVPLAQFFNGNFENDFAGWDLFTQWVSPGTVLSANSTVLTQAAGCPIPADPTPYPVGQYGIVSPGQSRHFVLRTIGSPIGDKLFDTSIVSGGPNGKYAYLQNYGTVDKGPRTLYGPMIVSQNPVIAEEGDRISFNWIAQGGKDAYNVLAYIIDPKQSCKYFILLDETGTSTGGDTLWTTQYKVIGPGEAGHYYFVFISGTFDYNNGTGVGAALGVDEIQIQKAGTWS